MRRLVLASMISVLFVSTAVDAATIHVPADQPTIQAGINAAVNEDTVLVSPGTYFVALDYLGKAITVRSQNGPFATILKPSGFNVPIIRFVSGETNVSTLTGFTLRGGFRGPDSSGGAIYCRPGSPTIKGNVFDSNHAHNGGAIAILGGIPIIDSNEFIMNSCRNAGGAIAVVSAPPIVATGAYLTRNLFLRNSSDGNSGAVYSSSARVVASFNRFVRNHSYSQAGAFNSSSGARDSVTNNTFYGNSSDSTDADALAIWYCDSCVALNNIFAFNAGPGIFQQQAASYHVNYNDVFGNAGGDYSGIAPGTFDFSLDPLLLDTASLTLHLSSNSPCIDAGHPGQDFNDQDGSRNDIGAIPYVDSDGDNVQDALDNCPTDFNPSQADADNDGVGDICDACLFDAQNDIDSDGICGNVDNCPTVANSNQADTDNDGVGNLCDNCPSKFNPAQEETDGDGIADSCDNCPVVFNSSQTDVDNDGIGNACDACLTDPLNDSDADGICHSSDNCPSVFNPDQADANSNNIGDVCDCLCLCHGDPACDSVIANIVDVVSTVNVAFRGAATITDPSSTCPWQSTDTNCSGTTDVIDVVKVVNVAFRGASVATEYCEPCP